MHTGGARDQSRTCTATYSRAACPQFLRKGKRGSSVAEDGVTRKEARTQGRKMSVYSVGGHLDLSDMVGYPNLTLLRAP